MLYSRKRGENMKEEKRSLKEIIAYEKMQMLPLNFTVFYILTPIYAAISFLLIGAFAVLMEIDDEKYLVPGLFCLGAFIVISIVFLACVPFIRKKAIMTELSRYNFDTSIESPQEIYDFSTDELSLKFDKFGMYVNDELYYYNHLDRYIMTGNLYKRVNLYIQFSQGKEWYITLPVNPTTLKMLESLNIQLHNSDILEYILTNKKDAFEQIYNKGYIVIR